MYLFDIHADPGQADPQHSSSPQRKRKRSLPGKSEGERGGRKTRRPVTPPGVKTLRDAVVKRLGLGPSGEEKDVYPSLALVLVQRLEELQPDTAVEAAKRYATFLVEEGGTGEEGVRGRNPDLGSQAEEGSDATAGAMRRETELIIRERWGGEVLEGNVEEEEEGASGEGGPKVSYEVNIDDEGELEVAYSEMGGGDEGGSDGVEEGPTEGRGDEDGEEESDGESTMPTDEGEEEEDDSEEGISSFIRSSGRRRREVDPGVPVVYPTRSFTGHRNEDTVSLDVVLTFIVLMTISSGERRQLWRCL